jgi:hypothetical protein
MSVLSHASARQQSGFRAPLSKRGANLRALQFASPAFNELRKVMLAMAIYLVVMVALAALDVWVWTPHALR